MGLSKLPARNESLDANQFVALGLKTGNNVAKQAAIHSIRLHSNKRALVLRHAHAAWDEGWSSTRCDMAMHKCGMTCGAGCHAGTIGRWKDDREGNEGHRWVERVATNDGIGETRSGIEGGSRRGASEDVKKQGL